jgi:hypothetical protein
MKKTVLLVAFLVLVGNAYSYAAEGVQWYSLKEGLEKAKNEKKPSIVDFFYGEVPPLRTTPEECLL